jgi:hypothetical protein
VYKGAGKTERFFVEVKEKEPLRDVQKLCFRLIEDKLGCDVKICRVYPEECLSVGELGAEP